jgi:hypothetical protein
VTAPVRHETSLIRAWDWWVPWRAECACGWKSSYYCGRNEAEWARLRHDAVVAAGEWRTS